MRDRNLSFKQFHILLEKNILRNLNKFETGRITFSQELSLEFRPFSLHAELLVKYPRDFRSLRTLSIVQWYFPETLHFLVFLSLKEKEFSWLSWKQQIELSLLLDSKEVMEKFLFLTERYTGNEIFGNILGNDLKELLREMKISRRFYPKPRRKVWRRGPKDKGSRRVNSTSSILEEEIRKDVFLLEEVEKYQRKRHHLQTISTEIQIFLRKLNFQEDD